MGPIKLKISGNVSFIISGIPIFCFSLSASREKRYKNLVRTRQKTYFAFLEYKQTEDAYEVGTQFSKETHIRDEDDEMRKFIETEMQKRKVAN